MTIYDIAELAGVSASTVSRVINGKTGMSEKTRKKVQKLLDEYGFTVNESARSLVNKETRLVGILVPDIRFSHFANIAYHIEEKLREAGYCGIIYNTGLSEEKKVESIRLLEQRKVDGVILVSSSFQSEGVKKAIAQYLSEVPVVITNGILDLPNVYGVLVNEKEGVQNCIHLLKEKGHERIAFVVPNETPSNLSKKEGFLEAMGNEYEKHIYKALSTWKDGYDITQRILKEYPQCNGILFAEDVAATGALRYLLDQGKKIPDDVAVIGIDNSDYADVSYPRMTALDIKMLPMSDESAEILLKLLEGGICQKARMLFSEIVERETT